jgi:hypothetical protein
VSVILARVKLNLNILGRFSETPKNQILFNVSIGREPSCSTGQIGRHAGRQEGRPEDDNSRFLQFR